jgi:hypothetical protein
MLTNLLQLRQPFRRRDLVLALRGIYFRGASSPGRMGQVEGSCGETAAVLRDDSAVDFTPGIIAIQRG